MSNEVRGLQLTATTNASGLGAGKILATLPLYNAEQRQKFGLTAGGRPFHAAFLELYLSRNRRIWRDIPMRLDLPALLTIVFLSSAISRGDWQRTVVVDDPKITVTLLLKSEASKTIILDVNKFAAANDGMSTRACDFGYNAILDLLDRPGERFGPRIGFFPATNEPEEYAHRDALIAQLKRELAAR